MIATLPEALQHGPNQEVLAYLAGRSAHSDIALPLWEAVKQLPDVHMFCPDRKNFGYVVVYVDDVAFGFAVGMGGVTLRLPPAIVAQVAARGAEPMPSIGPEWVHLPLFGDGGFDTQLAGLAEMAHRFAQPPSDESSAPQPLRGSA